MPAGGAEALVDSAEAVVDGRHPTLPPSMRHPGC
jgi:hypothetical protein